MGAMQPGHLICILFPQSLWTKLVFDKATHFVFKFALYYSYKINNNPYYYNRPPNPGYSCVACSNSNKAKN